MSMRLAILDDDDQICTFLARMARDVGFLAETAEDVASFQALFRENRPGAVILDLQLKSSDGIEQLRFLHQEGFAGPIVLMSGFDQRVLAAAEKIGASLGLSIISTITKPARSAQVREILETIWQKNEPLTSERIDNALRNDEMSISLQPIVEAASFRVERLEALVRWHHPVRGLISPTEFISLAEQDCDVIDQLTMWVIEAAARQYLELSALGMPIPIAVNVSAKNLRSLAFPDHVEAAMRRLDVPASALTFEITESAATGDPTAMTDILTRLRLKGLSVSIDDFGTGYSSLIALHRLPFTGVKIDQSFVKELPTSREARVIVKSTVDLARNLGLQSVAEGVETEGVVATLQELGVDLLQGYFFSRPLAHHDLVEWLRQWASSH